jgi:hypothetical protein
VPRSKTIEIVNNFSKGLITEATGLNFPENACTDALNCVFDYKGVVTRRLGFDYENGYELDALTRSNSAISEFLWEAPNGDGTLSFVVVQVGTVLRFYTVDFDGALSPGMQSFTIDLTNFDTSGNPGVGTVACQFASGKGYLFVSHPYCDPFYVVYSAAGPSVTGTTITVKQRDFDGLTPTATYPDNITRPTSTRAALDDFDEYNLQNQGWDRTIEDDAGNQVNALTEWDTNNTTMPALSDIWYVFHDTTDPTDYNYNVGFVSKWPPSSGRAPQGHYILNSFLQERDVVSGIAGLSNDDVTAGVQRPATIAFYAGRVWYAGVSAAGYNSNIYFSQIITNDREFGLCYQANDPTAEDLSDLLPSDGGVIKILDVANIIKLFVMGPSMLIFASNGVWQISGSGTDGLGFAANDYTIRKLSSTPTLSASSFVDVEGTPMWWNREGIWTVQPSEIGNLSVQSLSRTTIHTLFGEIPTANKEYAKGAYNKTERVVQWLYSDVSGLTDVDDLHTYNRVLNLNVQSGAFYPWEIDTGVGVKINGIISARGSNDEGVEEAVTDSAVDVTDASGEVVTDFTVTSQAFAQVFHYFTSVLDAGTTFNCTWSKARDDAYVDWETHGTGADYDSYLITGYRIAGQAQRFFQSNYVFLYFNAVNNSSCYFQSIWDFATTASGGRYSTAQQIYRNRTNTGVQQARVKARGKGRAMQFKFYSEAGKPFNLIGWSTWSTQNADI